MPGWHAKTAPLAAAGKLRVLGVAQEQHADRTRLFMQWHQMDWPVLADPFNLFAVSAVPITLLVDEHGTVRARNPKPADLDAFLATDFPAPDHKPAAARLPFPPTVLAGDPAAVDTTLKNRRLTVTSPVDHFHTGVLYRMRHDSPLRRPGDFAAAVDHWRKARDGNPNQYIWRRRIQQYGPRLDKPYPFYDWVPAARAAITARGETPVPLRAEPSGAEYAKPARAVPADQGTDEPPELAVKVARDHTGLMAATAVVVPSTDAQRPAYRVHLTFTPNPALQAHWNNESGPAHLWIDGKTAIPLPLQENPPATSAEPRTVEFETASLPVRATLYFDACQGETGVCRHLAKDLTIAAP